MLLPTLLAGIEQRHFIARLRVSGMGAGPFVPVARGAGQTQVVSRRRPSFGPREDMVNLARETAEPLWGLTVLATALGASAN